MTPHEHEAKAIRKEVRQKIINREPVTKDDAYKLCRAIDGLLADAELSRFYVRTQITDSKRG